MPGKYSRASRWLLDQAFAGRTGHSRAGLHHLEGDVGAGESLADRAALLSVLGDLRELLLGDAVRRSPHGQRDAADPETARGVGPERDVGPDLDRLIAAARRTEQARELHREARAVRGGDELLGTGEAAGVISSPLGEGDLVAGDARADQVDRAGSVLEAAGPCGLRSTGRHGFSLPVRGFCRLQPMASLAYPRLRSTAGAG